MTQHIDVSTPAFLRGGTYLPDFALPRMIDRAPSVLPQPARTRKAGSGAEAWWLACRDPMVAVLQELLAEPLSPYVRICQIGCGSGHVMEDLARELPVVDSLVGFDCRAERIARNRGRMVDTRIRFETGNINDWVALHGRPGTIYLSVSGSFEYASRLSLQALFATGARLLAPAVFAMVEPIPDDLESAYLPRGSAGPTPTSPGPTSLGHDYLTLLRDAGFVVRHQQEVRVGDTLLLMMLAECW